MQMPYNPYMNYNYNPVPVPPQNNLSGRVVNDFTEITANDVPMDGNFAIFPKPNMNELQIRRWLPNGTIESRVLRACESVTDTSQDKVDKSTSTDIETLYKALNERLDKIEELVTRKEVADE